MPRRGSLVAVSVVAMLVGAALAGCGDADERGAAGPEGDAVGDVLLEGTGWVLDQEATELETVAPEVMVTARFDGGRLSGNAGCNNYTTTYTVRGTRLTVDDGVGTTLMACPPPASNVEAAYLELLVTARSYAIDGRRLTVDTSTPGVALVYDAIDPQEALQGSFTVLEYFRSGALTSPVAATRLTAEFAAGTVSGDSGCNLYSGEYSLDADSIRIGPLRSTLRACADPALNDQERDFRAALASADSFTFDRGNLVLVRADGGIAVTLARA